MCERCRTNVRERVFNGRACRKPRGRKPRGRASLPGPVRKLEGLSSSGAQSSSASAAAHRIEPELKELEAVVVVVPEVVLETGGEQSHCRAGAARKRRIRGAEGDREECRGNVLKLCVLASRERERERADDFLN